MFTFFSIGVWDDEASKFSKCDDVDDWTFNRFGCFISNCCANVDDDDDDDVDDCPMVVHCLPVPIDPNNDDEFDDGTVDTPPLLFTCKYDDGVDDVDELAVDAKCR